MIIFLKHFNDINMITIGGMYVIVVIVIVMNMMMIIWYVVIGQMD